MSWRSIAISNVRLSPNEKTAMQAIQGSSTVGAEVLLEVVREFVSAIRSGGNKYTDDDSIPDLVRTHVINRTRWLWLCEFPSLKSFQTEAREKLNEAAEKMLESIATGKVKVEAPATPVAGVAPGNAIELATRPDPARGATRKKLDGLI